MKLLEAVKDRSSDKGAQEPGKTVDVDASPEAMDTTPDAGITDPSVAMDTSTSNAPPSADASKVVDPTVRTRSGRVSKPKRHHDYQYAFIASRKLFTKVNFGDSTTFIAFCAPDSPDSTFHFRN